MYIPETEKVDDKWLGDTSLQVVPWEADSGMEPACRSFTRGSSLGPTTQQAMGHKQGGPKRESAAVQAHLQWPHRELGCWDGLSQFSQLGWEDGSSDPHIDQALEASCPGQEHCIGRGGALHSGSWQMRAGLPTVSSPSRWGHKPFIPEGGASNNPPLESSWSQVVSSPLLSTKLKEYSIELPRGRSLKKNFFWQSTISK